MRLYVVYFLLLSPLVVTSLNINSQWTEYKLKYKKHYTADEDRLRLKTFEESVKKINEHNERYKNKEETYTKGINQFTDMTNKERQQHSGLLENIQNILRNQEYYKPSKFVEIPQKLDYRDFNAVTPIKNQGMCSCCYAFTSLGCLESYIILKYNITYDLSEQNIVDCSGIFGTHGCTSGSVRHVYEYINEVGIMSENAYPYTGTENQCRWNSSKNVFNVKGFKIVPNSEDALLVALVEKGPIAAPVDAKEFYDYTSGIFEAKMPYKSLTHGVVIIGYGSEGGVDYWIVKNSWGEEWGEKGFARIRRKARNSIGIDLVSVYPEI